MTSEPPYPVCPGRIPLIYVTEKLRSTLSVCGLVVILLTANLSAAQNSETSNDLVKLENSQTLFAVLSAINNCGYDAELAASDPLRIAIRGESRRAVELGFDVFGHPHFEVHGGLDP